MSKDNTNGDKFSRHGNKGTIGFKISRSDYISTPPGFVPERITSPFSLPERMTIDKLCRDPNVTTEQLLVYLLHLKIKYIKFNEKN